MDKIQKMFTDHIGMKWFYAKMTQKSSTTAKVSKNIS